MGGFNGGEHRPHGIEGGFAGNLRLAAFLRYLCSCLATKLNGAVASSMQMPLKKRVALSLQYADDSQCITDIGRLAKTFNVSNRQLLRVLKDFCQEGILEHSQKGVYRILKKPEL